MPGAAFSTRMLSSLPQIEQEYSRDEYFAAQGADRSALPGLHTSIRSIRPANTSGARPGGRPRRTVFAQRILDPPPRASEVFARRILFRSGGVPGSRVGRLLALPPTAGSSSLLHLRMLADSNSPPMRPLRGCAPKVFASGMLATSSRLPASAGSRAAWEVHIVDAPPGGAEGLDMPRVSRSTEHRESRHAVSPERG